MLVKFLDKNANDDPSISFGKCVDEVSHPTNVASRMTTDETFQEAKKIFPSVQADF
ncbi:MAG: hypothetical protein V3R94_03735 [Acidobacteriota bacterium]